MAVIHQHTYALPRLGHLPLVERGQVQGHGLAEVVLGPVQVHGDQALLAMGQAAELEGVPVDAVAVAGRAEVLLLLGLAETIGEQNIAASVQGHALHLFAMDRILLPAAHAVTGNLIEAKMEEPGE